MYLMNDCENIADVAASDDEGKMHCNLLNVMNLNVMNHRMSQYHRINFSI